MVASLEVESIRAEIPATASLTYLNTGWQGPSPRSVVAAVQEIVEELARTGPPEGDFPSADLESRAMFEL